MRDDDAALKAWDQRQDKPVLVLRCGCGKKLGAVHYSPAGLVASVDSVIWRPPDDSERDALAAHKSLDRRRIVSFVLVDAATATLVNCKCGAENIGVDWAQVKADIKANKKKSFIR